MINQLVQLKNAQTTEKEYPCLFDDGNIEAMFRLMDPEGRGFISSAQFAEGNSCHHSHVMYVCSLCWLLPCEATCPVHYIQLVISVSHKEPLLQLLFSLLKSHTGYSIRNKNTK